MKSTVKLMKQASWWRCFWPFALLVMPSVNQAFTPPVVQKPEPVLPPPGVKHLQKVEDLVFEMTNQARRAKGLAPLTKMLNSRNVARAYSDDMLVRHFFDHTTPDGISFDERIAGPLRPPDIPYG